MCCVEVIFRLYYRRSWDFIKSSVSSSRSVISNTFPISAFSWNHTFALPLIDRSRPTTLHTTVSCANNGTHESMEGCVCGDRDVVYHDQRSTPSSIWMVKLLSVPNQANKLHKITRQTEEHYPANRLVIHVSSRSHTLISPLTAPLHGYSYRSQLNTQPQEWRRGSTDQNRRSGGRFGQSKWSY